MEEYEVTIKGITPLMSNRFLENEETSGKKGEVEDSPELADKKVYRVGDKVVAPSEWIQRAMEKVASEFKVEGMGRTTYKTLLPGNIFINPEYIPIEPQSYVIDKRSVVNPFTKGRVIRYRPKWTNWKLSFKIQVFDKRLKEDVLRNILTEAGRRVGIGDGRKIGFGRFVVTKFKKVKK